MTPQQANLAPCPFCGGPARHLERNPGFYDERAICDACNYSLSPAAWNRRAPAPTEPAVDRARDLEMRAEGRAEALSLILGQDPEDPFSEYTVGSGPCPATGEYDTQWDEKKLRELFKTGDKFFNLEAKTEMAFWEYQEAKMLIQYEAEQRRATPASPAVPAVPAAPTTILPTNESEK